MPVILRDTSGPADNTLVILKPGEDVAPPLERICRQGGSPQAIRVDQGRALNRKLQAQSREEALGYGRRDLEATTAVAVAALSCRGERTASRA